MLTIFAGFVAWGDVLIGKPAASIRFMLLAVVWGLSMFIPSLAVAVRRLHDTNSSGWWYLLALISYVGGLILVIWYCIKGTPGENRFGPDRCKKMLRKLLADATGGRFSAARLAALRTEKSRKLSPPAPSVSPPDMQGVQAAVRYR